MSNPIKNVGKIAVETLVITAINEVSKVLNEHIKSYIESVYKDLKARNEKYKNIRNFYVSPTTKFDELQQAILEASKIVNLLEVDLNLINSKNPISYVKYQFALKEVNKWKALLQTLKYEITIKIHNEAYAIYLSKKVSAYFDTNPEINDAFLSVASKGELNNLLLEIKKFYVDPIEAV